MASSRFSVRVISSPLVMISLLVDLIPYRLYVIKAEIV